MIWPVKAVASAFGIAMLVQAVPVPTDPIAALVALAGKLTVDAALLGGLWWMARKYDALLIAKDAAVAAKDAIIAAKDAAKDDAISKKDDAMVLLVEKVTQAMVLSNANMEALRQALMADGLLARGRERA